MGAIDKFMNALKFSQDDEGEYFDDYEVDEYDEKPSRKQGRGFDNSDNDRAKKTSKVTSITSKKRNSNGMEIICIKPENMEDSKKVTETLVEQKAVILNLNNVDIDVARRVLDFAMGSTYALEGTLSKITDSIFVIVPKGVDISGAFLDNMTE